VTQGEAPARDRLREPVRIAVTGELDVVAAREALKRLLGTELRRGDELILDLGAATFMDSAGIRLVLQCRDRALRAGARFTVVRGPEAVMRVLELVGLEDQLEIVEP
jgi:anti-sigma B factor antagonist